MDASSLDARRLFELAARAYNRLRRAVELKLRAVGITYAQYGALAALARSDGVSQSELASLLETDATTAMVLRNSLEKKGFVERASDERDGRVRRITITAGGRKALEAAEASVAGIYADAEPLVSETEAKKVGAVLERLGAYASATADGLDPRKVKKAEGGKRRGRPPKDETVAAARKSSAEDAGTAKAARARKAPASSARALTSKAASPKTASPKGRTKDVKTLADGAMARKGKATSSSEPLTDKRPRRPRKSTES